MVWANCFAFFQVCITFDFRRYERHFSMQWWQWKYDDNRSNYLSMVLFVIITDGGLFSISHFHHLSYSQQLSYPLTSQNVITITINQSTMNDSESIPCHMGKKLKTADLWCWKMMKMMLMGAIPKDRCLWNLEYFVMDAGRWCWWELVQKVDVCETYNILYLDVSLKLREAIVQKITEFYEIIS